jgi:tRNA-uridine 2-sulfurtransferase
VTSESQPMTGVTGEGRLRVLAAMSGGVDSAVAAARVAEAGHDVTGVHLALSVNPKSYRTGARGCCTLEDARDARRAADVIGIPFYVWDLAERFDAEVVQDFVAEYARGNTPNPCLRCNEKIKFAAVLDRAVALGFDAVCTGHHARLQPLPGRATGPAAESAIGSATRSGAALAGDRGIGADAAAAAASSGEWPPVATSSATQRLVRSVDPGKDQSYVLAVLTSEQLSRAMFPLGDSTKDQVRAEAARRGLAVADKPDSHDVCFIADGDTRGFLRRRLGSSPGPIVDHDGRQVGSHEGSYGFTVGQRRGLRLADPAADGKPRYVLDIEPVSGTVLVGPAEALDVEQITGVRPVWSGCEPPAGPIEADVQLRAHGEAFRATCQLAGEELRIRLHRPARGIAKGQAAVLYDNDAVLGSATIAHTA